MEHRGVSVCDCVVSKAHGSGVFIWGNREARTQRNGLHASLNSGVLKLAFLSLCINKCTRRDIDYLPQRDDADVKPVCRALFGWRCDLYSTQVSHSVITYRISARWDWGRWQAVNTGIDAAQVFEVMFSRSRGHEKASGIESKGNGLENESWQILS